MACEVFKIVSDTPPKYIQDLVNIKLSKYDFRREKPVDVPCVKSTRCGLRSFRYEAASIWNRLPNNLQFAESYPQFKRLLHIWGGLRCRCQIISSVFSPIFYSILQNLHVACFQFCAAHPIRLGFPLLFFFCFTAGGPINQTLT